MDLGQLCDALAERVSGALVLSILPLLKRRPALSAAQLQKDVAMRLNWLLKSCVLDLIFDQALPGAMRALKTQIEHVLLCVKQGGEDSEHGGCGQGAAERYVQTDNTAV